jgi:hypothetical protein
MQHFANSIHFFHYFRISLCHSWSPWHLAIQAIVSLTSLNTLKIIINVMLDTTRMHLHAIHSHHQISLLMFAMMDSPLTCHQPDIDDDFLSLKALLLAFLLLCHQLTIILPH